MKSLSRIAVMTVALLFGLGLFAVAAEAQSYPHPPNDRVTPSGGPGGSGGVFDPGGPSSTGTSSASASLPFTGGDVLGLVAIGAVLAGTGFAVVYTSRRRRHAIS